MSPLFWDLLEVEKTLGLCVKVSVQEFEGSYTFATDMSSVDGGRKPRAEHEELSKESRKQLLCQFRSGFQQH